MLLLLSRQAGKPGSQGMVGGQEGVFSVQDGWIGALGVVGTVDLPGPQIDPDRPQQRRVWIIVKFWIHQVGELAGAPMDFDDVGAFHVAEIGMAAALVDIQERIESIQGMAVDVEVVRKEPTERGALAGVADGSRG